MVSPSFKIDLVDFKFPCWLFFQLYEVIRSVLVCWTVETGFMSGCRPLLCCHRYWRLRIKVSRIEWLSIKPWKRAFRILEDQVFFDCRVSLGNLGNLGDGVMGMQVNLFIFDCPSQPFYEDVIPPSASDVQGNGYELWAQIGIKYIWLSIPGKRLLNSFNADV